MKEFMEYFSFKQKMAGESGKSRFWQLERCLNCPNAVIDLNSLAEKITRLVEEMDFENRRGRLLKTDRPMHHQVFRISLAGCPNSCSQPQIKDLGIQGQAIPEIGEGCTLCGDCVRSCPDGLIILSNAGPEIERNACLNCGHCARACPAGVITTSKTGFRVLVGGKLGRRPRLAEAAVEFGGEEAVEAVLRALADLLTDSEFVPARLGSILDKKGMAWIKKNLIIDRKK